MSRAIPKNGSFALLTELGTGASARVWQARDPSGELVVLKIGHRADAAATFASEALHSALALSPRLPELVGLGVCALDQKSRRAAPAARGLPYLALRWREGRALSAIRDEGIDLGAVAWGLGEALSALHELGLCHGDVKPDNILVAPEGVGLIDLGLVGDAYDRNAQGATPRYLARGDPKLGDGRARDLLALGLVLAELVDPSLAHHHEPLPLARTRELKGGIGAIATALIAPDPGARPSADWVCRAASAHALRDHERHLRRLRASYLRLRRTELTAEHCDDETAPWLAEALAVAARARAMCTACGVAPPSLVGPASDGVLAPLDGERRLRWLVSLVGPAATNWAGEIWRAREPELVRALSALALCREPHAFTLADINAALRGERAPSSDRFAPDAPLDAAFIARLALALANTPSDQDALATIERREHELPRELVLRAVDALRLAGELGRARSLLGPRAGRDAIAADVLRRSGDFERAKSVAEAAIADGTDRDGRARACLARIALDRLEPLKAAALTLVPSHAAEYEVAALAAMELDDSAKARAFAEQGYAVAIGEEQRARLAATIAFVIHPSDPARARERFGVAAMHAENAGAVLEEASYRTGVAAACVQLGELEAAEAAARRAALLFDDVLQRPNLAARAWLSRAAVWAALDATHEALLAAKEAITRARSGGDVLAEAYGHWAVADALPLGDPRARDAANSAAALLQDAIADRRDDGVHTLARIWRHASAPLDRDPIDVARASPSARLAWWSARAERLLEAPPIDVGDARRVLEKLSALIDAPAPVAARGKAMYAARRVAVALGDTARCEHFEAARRAAAAQVSPHATTFLAEAMRSCRWLEDSGTRGMPAHHNVDLQQLVRALGERDDLEALLARVVDVLIIWTGAERGLILLRKRDGRLVPRTGRKLSRKTLEREQLVVSTSLAERALATGEPVVAVDAMSELSASHASVHALELRSVLVLPLVARGEVLGALYLDDRFRKGAFGEKELAWATTAAPIAAIAIADARAQSALRRAVAKANRASAELAQALAHKESALAVAETELARASGKRVTRFRYDEIIGDSEPIQRMLGIVDRLASSNVPVLLRGESGTGKELVARAIHRHSARDKRAFVSENCGALPEPLLESTLFGHVRGAFTGAHRDHVGLFEAADGGTLFLDELGELGLAMQTKLLRVLEDGMVRPVGSERARRVDVRIVAATHRDLEELLDRGAFREDLYYRLNVITVHIPALRERSEDIPLLLRHFLEKHAPDRRVRVTTGATHALAAYPWPGNIRQLENEVRRALLVAEDVIDVEHLSLTHAPKPMDQHLGLDVRARIDRLERDLAREALDKTHGNQTQAAKLLGLSRFGLHKLMKRLSIVAR